MTLNASATSCYSIMLNIKCLDKVSNERIYDLTGTSSLAINSNLTSAQVPWPHLGTWRRMLTVYFVWLPGKLHTSFSFFGSYLRFLLVKTTSGWPLRSSAEMLHEIQVWLIIVGQPKSSQLKVVSSWLGLGQCAWCHKKNLRQSFPGVGWKRTYAVSLGVFSRGGEGGEGGGGELIQSKMSAGPSFFMHKMWPCHNTWGLMPLRS